jgi:hypothetical protein
MGKGVGMIPSTLGNTTAKTVIAGSLIRASAKAAPREPFSDINSSSWQQPA